ANILNLKVVQVAAGAKHSLVRTRNWCFAFGLSNFGQLGCGQYPVFTKTPIIIDAFIGKNIVDLSAGQYHSLALDDQGHLYTWGMFTFSVFIFLYIFIYLLYLFNAFINLLT